MKLPRLFEIFSFKKKIREASLDVDKFTQHIPKSAPHSQGSTFDDVVSQYGHPMKPSGEKSSMFTELCPQPREGGKFSLERAKQLGFKKITNWYVNPKHWGRGQNGDPHSLNWEGTDWIEPKTPQAKEFVRAVHLSGRKPVMAYEKTIWDRYFKDKFGAYGE